MAMSTMALYPASLILLSSIVLAHNIVATIASAPISIRCFSGWSNTPIEVLPLEINDGYCDCPLDGLDEPATGACSGSMDGMWIGIPPKHGSSDLDAARPPATFACPEQPSLRLPLGRVNDGICDCCDGADEISPSRGGDCPDICDQVLAEERVARAKAQEDFAIGSIKRSASLADYKKWRAEAEEKLWHLKEVDLAAAEKGLEGAQSRLKCAQIELARGWLREVNEEILSSEPLIDIVGGSSMALDDLASFIISLCLLSAEASPNNIANGRCVALDRASLDLGIIWNYSTVDDRTLPSFDYLESETEAALVDFAEKITLRLEGKDTKKDFTAHESDQRKKRQHEPVDDSSDDPYGDDWEDHHDHHYDDDFVEQDGYEEERAEPKSGDESEANEHTSDELVVKSLLEKVPFDRALFKEQSKTLLKYSIGGGSNEAGEEKVEEPSSEDVFVDDGSGEDDDSLHSSGSEVDPMALQMVKSAISKRLSNISRGQTSAKSAARFVVSVMRKSDSILGDMKNLAIMTLYHSNVTVEDVAELVYSAYSNFQLTESQAEKNVESSCSASWSVMCPPRTFPLPSGQKSYPPQLIVDAAQKRCDQRESFIIYACTSQDSSEVDFPDTVPDGYYDYYEPQPRGSGDSLAPYFSLMDSLNKIPEDIVISKRQNEAAKRQKQSLTKSVADLEREIGSGEGDNAKYGLDGELFFMRDTCLKIESGKYEYEVCIFGKATQRDIGQSSGGTNLGSWKAINIREDGQRILKWDGGTKCWNGPVRSAEVYVTCGAETKLLSAEEPETCRYVLNMKSPIGCDEQFKIKNSLTGF